MRMQDEMNQAMMDCTRPKNKPLGGCLPILVQIPVFIALYWVLFEKASSCATLRFYSLGEGSFRAGSLVCAAALMMGSMLVQTR